MTSPATARPHSQGRRSLGSTYRQQDAFFRDHTQSRPAVTRFDDEEEQEQPQPGLRGTWAKMRHDRKKAKAEKAFDKQFEGEGSAVADNGPRAALYKGEMGQTQRRAARMHQESSSSRGGSSSSKAKGGGFGSALWSKVLMAAGAVVACFVLTGALLYPTAQQYYLSVREHDQVVAELDAVRARNQELAQRVQSLGTAEGIQERAHEEYGWVLPGENSVYVQGVNDGSASGSSVAANVVPGSVKAPETWYSPFLDKLFGFEQ